jgi:hypothetical protein
MHAADLGQGRVADQIAVADHDQVRLHRLDGLEQATVRAAGTEVADAERGLERGDIAVAESLHEVPVPDQAEEQLLRPTDAGQPVATQLLVGDVQDSHVVPGVLSRRSACAGRQRRAENEAPILRQRFRPRESGRPNGAAACVLLAGTGLRHRAASANIAGPGTAVDGSGRVHGPRRP